MKTRETQVYLDSEDASLQQSIVVLRLHGHDSLAGALEQILVERFHEYLKNQEEIKEKMKKIS